LAPAQTEALEPTLRRRFLLLLPAPAREKSPSPPSPPSSA